MSGQVLLLIEAFGANCTLPVLDSFMDSFNVPLDLVVIGESLFTVRTFTIEIRFLGFISVNKSNVSLELLYFGMTNGAFFLVVISFVEVNYVYVLLQVSKRHELLITFVARVGLSTL